MRIAAERSWFGLMVILLLLGGPFLLAQQPPPQTFPTDQPAPHPLVESWGSQLAALREALVRLPLAAALGALLAFRPRRRGTPARSAPVIQTQIILSVVGAVVLLVVGASLARAFGIVGAANLIRYRAKIEDPKDAGVMLSTLSVGLAAGAGLYVLAVFGTLFILLVLWAVESLEPTPYKVFTLKIATKADARPKLEAVLRRNRIPFELRTTSEEETTYEVKLPPESSTDRISAALERLEPERPKGVEWEEKSKNKK